MAEWIWAEFHRTAFVARCSRAINYTHHFCITTESNGVIIFGTSDDRNKWKPKRYQHLTDTDYFKHTVTTMPTAMDIYPSLDNYITYTKTQHSNPEDAWAAITKMQNKCSLVSQFFTINHRIWDILVDMRTRPNGPGVVTELTKFSRSVPAEMWATDDIENLITEFKVEIDVISTLTETGKQIVLEKAMEFVKLLEDFHFKNYEGPLTWVDPRTLSSFIDKCFV